MKELTARQRETLRIVTRFINENGYSPSLREIGNELGISGTLGVTKHLEALEKKGYLSRQRHGMRRITISLPACTEAKVAETKSTQTKAQPPAAATGRDVASPALSGSSPDALHRKKVVIAGSASNQAGIEAWVRFWADSGYDVINRPKKLAADTFTESYRDHFTSFYRDLGRTDALFVANCAKDGVDGYIGAAVFAEIAFCVAATAAQGRSIDIVLMRMPSPEVKCYQEISLWLALGWVRLMPDDVVAAVLRAGAAP